MVTSLTLMFGCSFSNCGMSTFSRRFTSGPSELYASQNVIVVVLLCVVATRAPAVAAIAATATMRPSARIVRLNRISSNDLLRVITWVAREGLGAARVRDQHERV